MIHKVRSLRADYNVPKNEKLDLYLKCNGDDLLPFLETILFLTSSATVNITNDIPSGCAITTISENCEAHLLLKVLYKFTFTFYLFIYLFIKISHNSSIVDPA